MSIQEKSQIEHLAAIMLDMQYDEVVNNGEEYKIHEAITEEYGIDFDNFCNLVWDIMDWTPALGNPNGKSPAHVLGSEIASTTGSHAFFAIVVKPTTDN